MHIKVLLSFIIIIKKFSFIVEIMTNQCVYCILYNRQQAGLRCPRLINLGAAPNDATNIHFFLIQLISSAFSYFFLYNFLLILFCLEITNLIKKKTSLLLSL